MTAPSWSFRLVLALAVATTMWVGAAAFTTRALEHVARSTGTAHSTALAP